jgi:hypothetical protein
LSSPTLAELIRRDLHGDHTAARIAGELGSLSRDALRRLACDATIDLVTLGPRPTDPAACTSPASNASAPRHDDGQTAAHPIRSARLSSAQRRSDRRRPGQPHRHRPAVPRPDRPRPALRRQGLPTTTRPVRRPPRPHWADGGPTDLHNLVLLCHQHHHDHHDRGHDLPHHDGHRWLTQTGWRHAPP